MEIAQDVGCASPVVDAEARFSRTFEGLDEEHHAHVDEDAVFDLDDDGKPELFVTTALSCGSGGCGYYVYRGGEACASLLGEFWGFMSVGPGMSHGMHDLYEYARGGGGVGTSTLYVWDGTTYRARSQQHCDYLGWDAGPGVTLDEDGCEPWRSLTDADALD